jgi:hypothetical protein
MRQPDPLSKIVSHFLRVSKLGVSVRVPARLDAAGRRLWRSTVEVFDFTDEPHKIQILTQACRVADVVAELDDAADEAPLTVKGSMGQQVISPFIAEARAQRALLAQLLSRLGLPDTDEESQAKAEKISHTRRRAAKS